MRFQLTLVVLLVLAIGVPVAQAEVATALLREGDPLPDLPGNFVVDGLNNTAVDRADAYSVSANGTDGVTTLSLVWGDYTGGAGTVLRTEKTIGDYEQTSYESFYGMCADPAAIAYSPMCNDLVGGSTSLDGVWLNNTPIAVEEQPYPHLAGWYWSFGSRPDVTSNGAPYFVGGITDVLGGSTDNRGLFYGTTADPVLLGGNMVTGLPNPLSAASTVSFDYRYSSLGTHYLAEVQTVTGSSTNDNHMVSDGAVLLAGGAPISENGTVPPEVGGLLEELWDNFDYCGINEAGQWMFTGDTNADTGLDEIVVRDGQIVHREGDTIDGQTVTGSISGAYLNEDGDCAFIWTLAPDGLEALFFNGELVLKEGDPVDWDGDGTPDPGALLVDFSGISTLTISDRDANDLVRIYFTAEIEVAVDGTPVQAGPLAKVDLAGDTWDERGYGPAEASAQRRPVGARDGRLQLEGFFVLEVSAGASGVAEDPTTPGAPRLAENWLAVAPNPAVGRPAEILYRSAGDRETTVEVYDFGGRIVRSLCSATSPAGVHTLRWDGLDDRGRPVPAGVYFIKMRSGAREASRRVTIVR